MVASNGVIETLDKLKWFVELLQPGDFSNDEICQLIGLNMIPNTVTEIAIFELLPNALFTLTGSFGMRLGNGESRPMYPLNTNSHVGASIIGQKTIWLENSDELFLKFPKSTHLFDTKLIGSLIATPIKVAGKTHGCLLVDGRDRSADERSIAILELIATIIGLKLSAKLTTTRVNSAIATSVLGLPLTVRELLLQELMAAGLTNKECAVNLGFSESTIRQDAVAMFAKLGVKNRRDAGDLLNKK